MRPIRHVRPGHVYEITTRATNRQHLLRPSKQVNQIIVGVIGRAQKHTGVKIYGLVFMSTHYHMLVGCESAHQQRMFMTMLNCNISKKLNRLNHRTGSTWSRRFRSILVANDRASQERRLRYLLAHGVKERLVARAKDWPGASSLPWLIEGRPIRGVWTSLTDRYNAKRRGDVVDVPGQFDTMYELELSVLPCWRNFLPEEWRALVVEMVADAERDEGKRCLEERSVPLEDYVLGVDAILATDPHDRLAWQRRTRAPSVHAVERAVRKRLRQELQRMREAYAESSQRFRAGEWDVGFPAGTFRPEGGFVAVC